MMVGSMLGVLFVSLVRRVMVEDPELPFPESVAASEIHKAGQRGAEAAKFLFYNIGHRRSDLSAWALSALRSRHGLHLSRSGSSGESRVRLGPAGSTEHLQRRRRQRS